MADLRIGKVSAVDMGSLSARVMFYADSITSGWLKVVQSPTAVTATGKVTEEDKEVEITPKVAAWFPVVGEMVLCIYDDYFNGDGFIIGGIR